MRRMSPTVFRTLGAVILLWGISFSLACRLASAPDFAAQQESGAWERMLGSTASLLSAGLYEQADLYFHKGVPHQHEKEFSDPFQRIAEVIAPTSHVHLHGERETLEIMPWLSLATKADPHNVEAYQVAVYWLKAAERIDDAEQVLRAALADNPGDYRLQIERALIALARGEYAAAARSLDSALRQWPQPLSPENDEALLDLGRILRHRALLAESAGQTELAAELLRREHRIFPERANIAAEIERLASGQADPDAARQRLALLQQSEAELHECERCEH